MKSASHHVPLTQLIELIAGQLPPEAQTQIRRHLVTCWQCARHQTVLERGIMLMRRDTSVDAPADVIARAVRIFPATPPPSTFSLRHVLATLRFDSAQPAPTIAVRAPAWRPRQLLYTAERYDLDLRMIQAGGMWTVKGQVLGPCSGGLVELRGGAETAHSPLDELCTFTLPPVPAGTYTLILSLSEVEVELPGLEVGS
jgi:hypothetical protein